MPVREFDGTDDQIVLGGGAIGAIGNGANSLVVLLKPTTLTGGSFWLSAQVGTTNVMASVKYQSGTDISHASDASPDTISTVGITTSEWQVLGVDRASAGNVVHRGHRKVLGSGSWTHANSGATKVGTAGTTNRVEIGSVVNIAFGDFRGAVMALFTRQLSDSEYVSIESNASTQFLHGLGPVALWELNQANVADDVLDLTGGGANETAITGTTVVGGDDPAWTFGLVQPGPPETFTAIPFMR